MTLIDKDEPTDLIGWFKECLVDGLAKTGVDRSDIATVILTGGSSQWPFVPEIVREVLYVDPGRIRRSDRPYAAIAQGLAIEPALRRAHETTRQKLEVDLPRFLREKVGKLVDEYIQGAANDIADTITSELFDGQVKPTLVQFRENGGTIAELKAKVAIQAQRFEPQIQSIVTSVTDLISKGLPVLVLDELRKWFEANGLRIDRDMLEVSGDRIATTDVGMVELHDMLQGFNRVVAGVTGTIVGAVAASVCGGGGTALIASGPIGGLIGLVIGAALAYVAVTAGMGAARARAEAIHLPSKVMWLALRDAKIDSARRKLRTETHEQIFRELYKLRATLNGQLENLVMKEIAALTELHHL